MVTIIELEEKIEGMPFQEALDEVNKVLADQGEHPDEDILLLKARVLFAMSEADPDADGVSREILEIITPFIRSRKLEPYYPNLLYMAVVETIKAGGAYEAQALAAELYEIQGDAEAAFLLAYIYAETGAETEKALGLIEEYLKDGDYLRGAPVKIDLLIGAARFGEAESLLKFCEDAYPEQAGRWLSKRAYYYHCAGKADDALRLTDQLLEKAEDGGMRHGLFHNACLTFIEDGVSADGRLARYIKDYIRRYPQDAFAYNALAQVTEADDPDAAVGFSEEAYRIDGYYAYALLDRYLKRNGEKDPEKYFAVYGTYLTDQRESHWSEVKDTVYGEFYPYDNGQSARILEKDLSFNPDHECAYTMLGKIYEYGIGVPKDAAKALSYYELGHMNLSPCGCGNVFYAYALYYGIGAKRDVERAKQLLLDVFYARDDDPDRECLYAVMAFEAGEDPRFDRNAALTMLEKNEDDAVSAYLLYRFTADETAKKEYFARFQSALKGSERLERDTLQKYADDPALPFVIFIRN